jgi:myo-inositol catabolism protein IolC
VTVPLGYDGDLYILAFDHRGSFQKGLFGIKGAPSPEDRARISDAKAIIFEGFRQALDQGAPRDAAGMLVDEEYGADLARSARKEGLVLAMPVEKSGQDEFDFEYGETFGDHLEEFDPTFAKVLVRYNPDGDRETNARQLVRLEQLSTWLHDRDRKFLFELLVPAIPEQLQSVDGDSGRYDREVRPGLMLQAVRDCHERGVEPDVWKIEGLDREEDCRAVAELARSGGRDGVVCVVLGRGADRQAVEGWLQTGAGVPGFVGFAIGRTIWHEPLAAWVEGSASRADAAERIARTYLGMVELYRRTG